jgi:hypothetical protein
VNNCSDWRKPNGLKDDRQGVGLKTEPRVPRVVRKKPPGFLVTSQQEEYGLSAREHLTPLAATVFNDRVDRMVQRELAK